MKKLILSTISAIASIVCLHAEPAPKGPAVQLTFSQEADMFPHLAKLNGSEQTVKAVDGLHVVSLPFKFSVKTRLAIADDIELLQKAVTALEAKRMELIKHASPVNNDVGKETNAVLQKYYADWEAAKNAVDQETSAKIQLIPLADLDLENNPDLPIACITVLKPILLK